MDIDQSPFSEGMEINPLMPFPDGISVTEWIFEIIRPFIKGRTLEIESAEEGLVRLFKKYNIPVHLSVTSPEIGWRLDNKYKNDPSIRSVRRLNIQRSGFTETYSDRLGKFDTVIKLNNAFPSGTDKEAIDNIKQLLKEKGCMIIIIPVPTALYGGSEQSHEEIKNQNRPFVRRFVGSDFEIRKTQYFNFPATSIGSSNHSGLSAILIARKDTSNGAA